MIITGDCRTEMKKLITEGFKVQMCVSSPPYWGLRDYGTASWEGGDAECDHTISAKDSDHKAVFAERVTRGDRTTCLKCGAKRIDNQLGLEKTLEEYVQNLVEVFRLVRELLKDDGVLWLNLGDSYSGGGRGGDPKHLKGDNSAAATMESYKGIPAKNLIGIPWKVAFALQSDGWILRQDIIWAKPNPMPESVTDRCTKSHEYIFLLSKSAKYFYDADAIKEPFCDERMGNPGGAGGGKQYSKNSGRNDAGSLGTGVWLKGEEYGGRNKRSVWTVATKPYKEAHFATFPPALIEPCILAGSRKGDTVLDPFFGSGTTGMVSEKHGREWIGIDLNPKYYELSKNRTAQRNLIA